ncbi:MAG: hypothetical protein Q7S92_04725 [Candidatus Diapherotrites archaeon]|nr:hypothetical protein [Candidatus Diapherotrites archaeon]
MPIRGKLNRPPLSAEARARIGLKQKRYWNKNRSALTRKRRIKAVTALNELQAKGLPLNPRFLLAHFPKVYNLARGAFKTYQKAIEKGLGLKYAEVSFQGEKKSKVSSEASKRQWAERALPEKRKRIRLWTAAREITLRKRTIARRAKVLSYRLRGFSTDWLAEKFGVERVTIVRDILFLRNTLKPEVQTALAQLNDFFIRNPNAKKANGTFIVSPETASSTGIEFRRKELQKLKLIPKEIAKLALTGKTNPEIAQVLNLTEKEVAQMIGWLPEKQFKKISLLRLRTAFTAWKAKQTGAVKNA